MNKLIVLLRFSLIVAQWNRFTLRCLFLIYNCFAFSLQHPAGHGLCLSHVKLKQSNGTIKSSNQNVSFLLESPEQTKLLFALLRNQCDVKIFYEHTTSFFELVYLILLRIVCTHLIMSFTVSSKSSAELYNTEFLWVLFCGVEC